METTLKGYAKQIQLVTECPIKDVAEVEEYMRHIIFHSNLDWQTKRQFNKGARDAWSDIQFMRSPEGMKYMNSLK